MFTFNGDILGVNFKSSIVIGIYVLYGENDFRDFFEW